MKGKTHQINHECIMTKNGIIVEGGEYLYKEGSYKAKVIVEKVLESKEWIRLKVFFPEKNERMVICHKNENFSFVGIWKLLDWTEASDSKRENKQPNQAEEILQPTNILEPGYKKAAFFKTLNENKLADILIHFNSIYNCRALEEKEMNLAWLSWIYGRGLLQISANLIIYPAREIEFELTDYEISNESETPGGVNLELSISFYQLDILYEEVLKSIHYK